MKKLLVILVLLVGLTSCTENERAKNFGGTMTVELPKGHTLVTATWKESELWYLTEIRPDSVKPKTYWFKEESNFGKWEGTVIFKEQ